MNKTQHKHHKQTNFSSALTWGNSFCHFTQTIVHQKYENEALGRWTNPGHLQDAHPQFLGSDALIAQGQLKRDDLVQWDQILRQPARLKPCCDGSVLLVKLVFQEGKENEALHHRISFGKCMKISVVPALHSQRQHWNFLLKAGLNKQKKNTVKLYRSRRQM